MPEVHDALIECIEDTRGILHTYGRVNGWIVPMCGMHTIATFRSQGAAPVQSTPTCLWCVARVPCRA